MKRSLDKVGIQWQRRPEKKWLAELLANERAIGPLLVCLKDTEVGSVMGQKPSRGAGNTGRHGSGGRAVSEDGGILFAEVH